MEFGYPLQVEIAVVSRSDAFTARALEKELEFAYTGEVPHIWDALMLIIVDLARWSAKSSTQILKLLSTISAARNLLKCEDFVNCVFKFEVKLTVGTIHTSLESFKSQRKLAKLDTKDVRVTVDEQVGSVIALFVRSVDIRVWTA